MPQILVLHYSMSGHIERMADAVAGGARGTGADVAVKRVPELVPEEVARKAGANLDQPAPVRSPQELDRSDAIIVGSSTRYRRTAAQMANFWDQTGGLADRRRR